MPSILKPSTSTSLRRKCYFPEVNEDERHEHDYDLRSLGGLAGHSVSASIDIDAFEKRLESLLDDGCGDENLVVNQLGLVEEDDTEILEIFPISKSSLPERRVSFCLNAAKPVSLVSAHEQKIPVVGSNATLSNGNVQNDSNTVSNTSNTAFPDEKAHYLVGAPDEFDKKVFAMWFSENFSEGSKRECIIDSKLTHLGHPAGKETLHADGCGRHDEQSLYDAFNGLIDESERKLQKELQEFNEAAAEPCQPLNEMTTASERTDCTLDTTAVDSDLSDTSNRPAAHRTVPVPTQWFHDNLHPERLDTSPTLEGARILKQDFCNSLVMSDDSLAICRPSIFEKRFDPELTPSAETGQPGHSLDLSLKPNSQEFHTCSLESADRNNPYLASSNPLDFDFKLGNALFGRENELTQLRHAFVRVCNGSSEVLHVRGSSGTGKTHLVTRALRDYVSYQFKGWFVSGKFDMLRMNEPYSAVLDALTDWCRHVLSGDPSQLRKVSMMLKHECPDDLDVLKTLIPPVELLCGRECHPGDVNFAVTSSGGSFLKLRYSFLKLKVMCVKLVKALSSSRPTVFFLDDTQWADSASRSLVQALCSDVSSKNIVFVLVCRDQEYHKLRVDLLKNRDRYLETSTIALRGLDADSINDMLSYVLGRDAFSTIWFAQLLANKTNGNIYHVVQYLKTFRDDGVLFFSNDHSRWQWDAARIEFKTSSVDDLLHEHVMTQDPRMTSILEIAACIGYRFDTRLLNFIVTSQYENGSENTLKWLVLACRKGFITELSSNEYMFSHDKAQKCCYDLIHTKGGREAFHLKVGIILYEKIKQADNSSDSVLFLATDHMNEGSTLITNREKRIELASLNLRAGKRLIAKADCDRAAQYFRNGISILSSETAWTDNYELNFKLHTLLAFTALHTQEFEENDMVIFEIMEHAATLVDSLDAAYIMMESLAARGEYEKGVNFALKTLDMLQFRINSAPNQLEIAVEAVTTRRLIRMHRDVLLLRQNFEPSLNATMKVLSFLALFAYYSEHRQRLFSMTSMKMVQLSYTKGLAASSADGFIWYGVLHAGIGNAKTADKFCSLGRSLLTTMKLSDIEAPSLIVANSFVNHQRMSLVEINNCFKHTFKASLHFGDTRMTIFSALGQISTSFHCGLIHLEQVDEETRLAVQCMRETRCTDQLRLALPFLQAIMCLQGRTPDPGKLSGNIMTAERLTEGAKSDIDAFGLELVIGLRLLLALCFEKWELIRRLTAIVTSMRKVNIPHWSHYHNSFITAIACWTLYRRTRQSKYFREASRLTRTFQKLAEQKRPGCQRKYLLLKAEEVSFSTISRIGDILDSYAKAIEIPIVCEESLIDEALANERSVTVFLERNDKLAARRCALRAIECYALWGATAKVRWLETKFYSLLFEPELHRMIELQNTVRGRGDVVPSRSTSTVNSGST